jgi:hypothetical protein
MLTASIEIGPFHLSTSNIIFLLEISFLGALHCNMKDKGLKAVRLRPRLLPLTPLLTANVRTRIRTYMP